MLNFKNIEKDKIIFFGLHLILLIAFTLSYLYIFDNKFDPSGDNFNYLNYAKSIVNGRGYTSPYTPAQHPTNWFPPGYSVILALVMFFTGQNIVAFKIATGLFFLFGILIFNNLILKITKDVFFSFAISLFIILNSGLLRLSNILMSEMPFLFFSVIAFYFVFKLKEEVKFWKSKYFYGIVLSTVASFYLRTQGIILLLSIVLFYLTKKNWKLSLGILGGFSVLYLPWIIRNAVYGLKGRYLGTIMTVNPWHPEQGQINTIGEFIEKMIVNLGDTVIVGFPEVMFPFLHLNEYSRVKLLVLGFSVLFIVLFGAWKIKSFRNLFLFYILGNIAIFLIWHGGNRARYVWILTPYITFSFFYGIYNILSFIFKKKNKRIKTGIGIIAILMSFLYFPKYEELNTISKMDFPPFFKNYLYLAKDVKWMNDKNIVVACRKPGIFHYYSKSYVVRYKFSNKSKEVIKHLIKNNVNYVVLDQLGYNSTQQYLFPAIKEKEILFEVVKHLENPDTYLIKFNLKAAKRIYN